MRCRFAVLLIFGMVAVSEAAFADEITVTEQKPKLLAFTPITVGVLVLCEGSTEEDAKGNVIGCFGGLEAWSDVVTFSMTLFSGAASITICSDEPEGNASLCPHRFNLHYVHESNGTDEGVLQATVYTPKDATWPGFNKDITKYTLISDTVPEPSSLLLLGTGLVGLVPVIRRKLHK